jgi:hypothetical protein
MLINITHTKRIALDYSQKLRNGKFTRVSRAFLEDLDRTVKRELEHKIRTHPSKGKTLMGGQ